MPQDNDLYLERAPGPEGVDVAAASKGHRKMTQGNEDPRGEA